MNSHLKAAKSKTARRRYKRTAFVADSQKKNIERLLAS